MPKAKILSAENLSPTVKLYKLRADRGLTFIPGQFFTFLPVLRAYSFCSPSEELPEFRICVRQVERGLGTNFINDHIGQTVEISAAQGSFVLPEKVDQAVFLAAGVGISPVWPLIQSFLKRFPRSAATLIYKFSGEGEYIFGSEFEELAGKHRNFIFLPVSDSRESYLEKLVDNIPRGGANVFVVGPPEFVNDNLKNLRELGYNNQDINFDIW